MHYYPTDEGGIAPCFRTAILGHDTALAEVFDADQGGLSPCSRLETEMLEGGHIGNIETTHFHPTERGLIPCFKTEIVGHDVAIAELFDAAEGDVTPCFRVEAQMLEGGALGPVAVTVETDLQGFSVRVGSDTYFLRNGKLQLNKKSRV